MNPIIQSCIGTLVALVVTVRPASAQPATPAAVPATPAPAPATPSGPAWMSLRVLHDKGLISDAELASALSDIGVIGSADTPTLVISRFKTTIYGFLENSFIHDSTESCVEICGNTQIQRPGTYRGEHGRTVFSARSSRFGLRLAAPEQHGVRVSAMLETDFMGPTATTEQGTWSNAVLRIRNAYFKMETPVVDITIGQTYTLFGWQSSYLVASGQPPGLPGQLFERTSQLRLARTVKTDLATVDLAVAANRPPQQDSSLPEGVAGLRLGFDRWTGQHTGYLASTAIQPASIAISGDVRGFRIPELAANPHTGHAEVGGGIALSAYLPIIPATKQSADNALSLTGELAVGSGTSDAYTNLGAAGTANASLPGATTAASTATDPGLVAIDATGHVELIKWTSYIASIEYYPAGTGGRVGSFANYGHMASANARHAGTAATGSAADIATARSKIRDHEELYEIGGFFDPTRSTRIGASASLYNDTYADGQAAKNYSLMLSGWLFY